MVDKTPGDLTGGTPSRDSIVHSTEKPIDLSRGHREDDISRLQSAVHPFDNLVQYKVDDIVTESGSLFRNITPNTPPAVFQPSEWVPVGNGTLQDAYDNGPLIKIDDGVAVKIEAPDGPASLFQPIIEVQDQDGGFPTIIEAGGEIDQQPLNLKLVSELISSPSTLLNVSELEIHSRFAFINTGATPLGVEVFSIADPELPRKLTTIGLPILTSASFFQHHGDILYVIDGGANVLKVVDIGVPTDPKLLGTLANGTNGAQLGGRFVVQGCFMYVIAFPGTLSILNLSDPANIEVVKVIEDEGISTLTNLAGTLSGYTDGEAITLSGGTGTGATATAIISGGVIQSITLVDRGEDFVIGDTLTITGDLSAANTATIDVATIFDLMQPFRLTIHENFLFITNIGTGVSVDGFATCTDISDPVNPIQLSKIVNGADAGSPGDPPFLDTVINLHATRDVVHFCDQANKAFTAIDYSDPTTPTVTDSIRDTVDGVSLGIVDQCTIAGKYAYIAHRTGIAPNQSLIVATINFQEATDLKFLKNVFIAGPSSAASRQVVGIHVTGDHLYMVNNATGVNGRFYSVRLSGIDTQSMRVGAGRFGSLDVKDELTARVLEASESIVVGGRGILSQGKIGGSKSSDIKRSVKTVVISGPASTVILDMTDDITTYIIDATGITDDWNIDVENIKAGHKIFVQALLPATVDDLIFAAAKFAIDAGDSDTMATTGDLAVIEAVLDTGDANTVIVTVTEI